MGRGTNRHDADAILYGTLSPMGASENSQLTRPSWWPREKAFDSKNLELNGLFENVRGYSGGQFLMVKAPGLPSEWSDKKQVNSMSSVAIAKRLLNCLEDNQPLLNHCTKCEIRYEYSYQRLHLLIPGARPKNGQDFRDRIRWEQLAAVESAAASPPAITSVSYQRQQLAGSKADGYYLDDRQWEEEALLYIDQKGQLLGAVKFGDYSLD